MKAVLVLNEMPEKCENCQFHRSQIGTFKEEDNVIANYGIELCRAENPSKPIARYLEENRPNWCPLKELPKKLCKHDDGANYPKEIEDAVANYQNGWNDCLDAILREEG